MSKWISQLVSVIRGESSKSAARIGVQSSPWPARFDMLTGWRGLAALAVVLSHVAALPIGQPAVILFFVISGYCITAAAESCLQSGFGFRKFMARRLRRIYPPYFLSIVFFAITRILKLTMGGGNQLDRPLLEWVQNLTLTQWLSLVSDPQSQPFNNMTLFVAAYWSLNYEEQFYLLVALLLIVVGMVRFSLRCFVLGLMVLALVWNACFPRLCFGFFIEYWAHFAIGCLLFYRLCRSTNRAVRWLHDGYLAGLAAYCGWLAWSAGTVDPNVRSVPHELCVAAGFALVLIYLRRFDAWFKCSLAGKILIGLGTVSYSLYLIHQFNLVLVHFIAVRLVPSSWPTVVLNAAQCLLHVSLAVPFWYLCERPFLNKSLETSAKQALQS